MLCMPTLMPLMLDMGVDCVVGAGTGADAGAGADPLKLIDIDMVGIERGRGIEGRGPTRRL
jgi:hypothetical protein